MDTSGGISLQITHAENYDVHISHVYDEVLEGIGIPAPNHTPQLMLNADIQKIYLNEETDNKLEFGKLISELSNVKPLTDLAREEDRIQIVPYSIRIAESIYINKSFFTAELNQSIISMLRRRREHQRILRLKQLATRLDDKKLAFTDLVRFLVSLKFASASFYSVNVPRTLLIPEYIVSQLATKFTSNYTIFWDIFKNALQANNILPYAYPALLDDPSLCFFFVDDALVKFDGYAPYFVDDTIDQHNQRRYREFLYSTDDFMIKSPSNIKPQAFCSFGLDLEGI